MGKSCATNREIGEIVGKVEGRVGLPRLVLGRMPVAVAPRGRSVVVKEGIVHGSGRREKQFSMASRSRQKASLTFEMLSRDSRLKLT